jgi:hypothetical protein
MMKIRAYCLGLLCLAACETSGARPPVPDDAIMAASPAYADVSEAISQAGPGDTVMVPSGTATWNSQLVISKGINLIGAGIGKTVITSSYAAPNPRTYSPNISANETEVKKQWLIVYNPADPAADEPVRVSGFTFDLGSIVCGILVCHRVTTYINQVRLDHIKLIHTISYSYSGNTLPPQPWAICVWGNANGVIDNCELDGRIIVYGMNTNWRDHTFAYGTAANLYIEDNTFSWVGTDAMNIVSSGVGGRYCFRHNTGNFGSQQFSPALDIHGDQGGGGNAGLMGAEIYGNTINNGNSGVLLADQRGGRGLVYDNDVVTSSTSCSVRAREEYLDSTQPYPTASDGETQHVNDSYHWSNTRNGTAKLSTTISEQLNYGGSIGLVPQADRDIFLEANPFDGSSGIGVGPLSARPAACAREGVAWWATNESRLYRWHNSAWELYYQPYTYPHPLRK